MQRTHVHAEPLLCYSRPSFHQGFFEGSVDVSKIADGTAPFKDWAQIEFQTMASSGMTLDQSIFPVNTG